MYTAGKYLSCQEERVPCIVAGGFARDAASPAVRRQTVTLSA